MWRYLVPAAFLVLVGFFIVGLNRDPSLVPSPLIGKPAPTYELPSVADAAVMVRSADFLGRKHVVNVWATWCVECRREHAALLEISRRNVLPIVGLDWKDERAAAQQWLAQLGNPYVISAFDEEGRVAIDFGVYGAPESFLIDEQGKVLYKHVGALTLEVWEQKFMPLINGSQAGQVS